MPAIVYLRSHFGFSFLSPKSVFIAFAWAHILFSVYAWQEEGAWFKYWAVACFGLGAVTLYLLHLALAFSREVGRQGKHDFDSGTSHLLRVPGIIHIAGIARLERAIQLWLEPFLVFATAATLRGFFAEQRLSKWLVIVAGAMWLKEFINFWYGIRAEKKHDDIIEDAEEKMQGSGGYGDVPLPEAGTRKPRTKRAPQAAVKEEEARVLESRHAEVLRLMPPYTLNQAEQNYRDLIKTVHPDTGGQASGATEKAAELNAAIEFFRRKSV